MIRIIFTLLALLNVSFAAEIFDLKGAWYTNNGLLEFIQMNGEYRTHTQEKFYNHRGFVVYTIDQYVQISKVSESSFSGHVTIYDSRGCTFRDLPVYGEVQNKNAIGFVMTVPRYKFRTITKASTKELVRTECRVLEYVEAPVKLYRY